MSKTLDLSLLEPVHFCLWLSPNCLICTFQILAACVEMEREPERKNGFAVLPMRWARGEVKVNEEDK